jgi:cation transport regulator
MTMPYQSIEDLPDSVRNNLPKHAQEIYKEAFNHAYEEYANRGPEAREETAHRVAWTAVKKKYRKDEATGKWREIS